MQLLAPDSRVVNPSNSNRFGNPQERRPRNILHLTACLILSGLLPSIAVAQSTSNSRLPRPTGPYSIGTRYLYLVDTNRPDAYTSDPADYREISLRVWYPAQPKATQQPTSYFNRRAAEFVVSLGFLKPSYLEEIALKPAHSYLNAEVAKATAPYPVVLFSASAVMDASILLAEELASHGYVVLFIGHPHWCEYYFDADGKIFFRDKDNDLQNKEMWKEENSAIVEQTKDQLTRARAAKNKLKLQRRLNENMPVEIRDTHLWAGDISFIIDELERMNLSSALFKGQLDVKRIGVMGYSKGGAAAGQACISEKRCRAGINLSGFMFGDIGEKELTVPFMVMEGVEPWCKDCSPINDLLFHTSKSSIYMVQVDGATHSSFSDLSAYSEYLSESVAGRLGSIDGRRFLEIQNAYVLQFFNRYLKGLAAPLLERASSEYPEVKFKSRRP